MKTATEREKKDKFFSLNTKMLLIYSIRIRSDVKFTIYMLREKKKYEIAYTFNIHVLRVFIVFLKYYLVFFSISHRNFNYYSIIKITSYFMQLEQHFYDHFTFSKLVLILIK